MKKIFLITPAVVVITMIIYSYSKNTEKTYVAKTTDFQEKILITGTVKSSNVIQISSEISGQAVSVPVEEGGRVNAEDILVRFDDSQIKFSLLQEQDKLNTAKNSLKKLDTTEKSILRSQLETAQSNYSIASKEYEKYKVLFEKKLLSESELNLKKNTYNSNYLAYIAAKNQFESATTGEERKNLVLTTKSAETSVKKIQDQLSKYSITSPVSGTVTWKNIKEGESVSTFSNLFEISSEDGKIIEINLDEKYVSRVKPGQKIQLFFPNNTSISADSEIYYVAPYVDKSNGTVLVKARIFSPPEEFLYNININGIILGNTISNAVIIPEEYLVIKNNSFFVYKKIGEEIEVQRVKIYPDYFQNVAVLEGLKDGETIVFPDDKIKKKVSEQL